MKKNGLFLLLMLLCSHLAYAVQPHHFYTRFTSWEGLPEAYLSCTCQDSFGRIWVGSRDGVYYYNGEKFAPFVNDNYLSGCSLNTRAIESSDDGIVWVASTLGTGYYDVYSDRFTILEEMKEIEVQDIDITSDGTAWFTSREGIWKYIRESGELSRVTESSSFSPFRACLDSDGNLVFTANNNCIYILNTATGNVRAVKSPRSKASFSRIEYCGDSHVLVSDGLHEVCLVDLDYGRTESIVDASVILNKAEVQSLLHADGLYWIGTTYGLVIVDPSTGAIEQQFPDELNVATLGGESVRNLYRDNAGNVWACTWNGGLRCWLTYEAGFSRFVSNDAPHTLVGNTVRSICNDQDGMIWVGSEEGYLCRFDPEAQSFTDYTSQAGIAFGTAITDITRIGSLLWIASYGDGITVFDPAKGIAVRKYRFPNNDCMAVIKASDGAVYAGTREGMYRYDGSSDSFEIVDIVGTPFIHSIIEDKRQRLIISTYYQGFGIYDLNTSSYRKVQEAQNDAITSFMFDSHSNLWATTEGSGICRIDIPADGSDVRVEHFGISDGFPSNSAGSITEDGTGALWVATSMGLVEFDPAENRVVKTYMQADNVIGRHFTFGSNFMSQDGLILLGTNEGLLMFDPEYVKSKFGHSPIHITDIVLDSAGGNAVVSQEGRSAITSESIRIRHKDAAYISITYSPMIYGNPNVESYECLLTKRGFRNHIVTEENHIAYTGLRPGTYRFSVNFAGSEDSDTEAVLDINIKAPWYLSNLAWVLYILLLGGLIYYYFRQRNLKRESEAMRHLELVEAKKEKDLAHDKMDFFTNIAHEIRTPVSVLQILLDKASSEHKMPEGLKGDMNSMRLNVERLKKLCDDLLDFRKMESGQNRLVFTKEDVCAIARKSLRSFETAAKAHEIEMHEEFSQENIIAVCDADAIESVICNLLSNAVKYSSSRIDCKVAEKDGKVIIRVDNDGVRVPEEESELIFEAFYQSKNLEKNGTGLGLTYSRKIASMHGGRLYLDTSVKDYNSFVLEIPVNNNSETKVEHTSAAPVQPEEDFTDPAGQRAVVLVVEDNDTMRDLIRDSLVKDYDILTAGDGAEALSIVRESRVDLVVSDIMMPKMDGCELCNSIKEDISLSHIPVLLLTAAVGVETHIRSLKSGADAYIEKPFKMDVLKANISNLFRNRDIRNEQFSSSPLSHYSFSNVSKIEQDFMNTLHSFIQDHISETELTIDRLSEAMAVSRATLTRKVKANTGLTVNEYVRISRLKKAVELLAENNYRINEVAYLVGYSSPSYFTLSFQKQFGKLPSEFIKDKTK